MIPLNTVSHAFVFQVLRGSWYQGTHGRQVDEACIRHWLQEDDWV